jgi:GNAT superfamily N-acetyltransferase
VSPHIERVDPRDLDLAAADEMAEVLTAASAADGVDLPARVGAAVLTYRRLGSDCRPLDGLWLAREGGRVVGLADLELPWRENTGTAMVRGAVHPDARRHGVGTALLEAAKEAAKQADRTRVYSGAFVGGRGLSALAAWGFEPTDGRYAVRRVDLHQAPYGLWDRLYDEAAAHAADYQLERLVGPTPEEMLDALTTLHEAINDAPANDADEEPVSFDAQRVRDYDRAMAGRHQTVHRVLARHRPTGEWAGLSMLCLDEFSPSVAFQEDTSVVRAHRGHRLGLLMKAEMLRWISAERPEVGAIDTWNAVTNHHMIAVNERLGATVVAEYVGHRLDL